MAEKIASNIYRIELPLPNNPLKALNSYLIVGSDRFLIIDTGMNREECASKMFAELACYSVDLNRTDFFITHLHADHAGLVGELASANSRIYFSKPDAALVSKGMNEEEWLKTDKIYRAHGFPAEELEKAMASHPGRKYSSNKRLEYCIVQGDDYITIGDFSFQCIETPGHTPGHMCLYESDSGILFSGDHILFDITPNITFWPDMYNALDLYIRNLDKLLNLTVKLVLPGHRTIWNDHRKRIIELKEHHHARLQEVLMSLRYGEKTAYDIAPHITWDIAFKSWEAFPAQQKLFAVGEAVAHIEYLEAQGLIERRMSGNRIFFKLCQGIDKSNQHILI